MEMRECGEERECSGGGGMWWRWGNVVEVGECGVGGGMWWR